MALDKENVWPYEGSDLQAFNDMTTCPWGYIELMIFKGEGRNIRIVDSRFLVVPCKNVYNLILSKPFAAALDIVASSIILKLKFHNLHSELVTINVDLEGVKRTYQSL